MGGPPATARALLGTLSLGVAYVLAWVAVAVFAGAEHPAHLLFPHRVYTLLVPSLGITVSVSLVAAFGAARVLLEPR
jgi:hypothetical protein